MSKNCHNEKIVETSSHRHWYVFRFYYNRYDDIERKILANDYEIYYPLDPTRRKLCKAGSEDEQLTYRRLLPSVVFVRCDSDFARSGYRKQRIEMSPLTYPGDKEPVKIPEIQMASFKLAVESGCHTFERISEEDIVGEHVRVIDGMFKGAEGYIVKLHCNKRFVVKIEGVAAFATIYLPPHLLVSIDSWYLIKLKNKQLITTLTAKLQREHINFVKPYVWNGSGRVNALGQDTILVKCSPDKLEDLKPLAKPILLDDKTGEMVTLSDVTVHKLQILSGDTTYVVNVRETAYVDHALHQCLVKSNHRLSGLKAYQIAGSKNLYIPIEKLNISLEVCGIETDALTLQSINQQGAQK